MKRSIPLAAAMLFATLACALPAHAASPVSDQYVSAPAPGITKAVTSTQRSTPTGGVARTAPPPAPGAPAGAAAPSSKNAHPAASKPVVVTPAAGSGAGIHQPLSSTGSDPPIVVLAALGLLALGLALAAAGRIRRPAATS